MLSCEQRWLRATVLAHSQRSLASLALDAGGNDRQAAGSSASIAVRKCLDKNKDILADFVACNDSLMALLAQNDVAAVDEDDHAVAMKNNDDDERVIASCVQPLHMLK